jgi:hypothetical protein
MSFSHAYESLKQTINPDCFGVVLGAGTQSLVFLPFEELKGSTSIKDPVLVITREEEKKDFFNQLFKDTTAKIENINEEKLSIDSKSLFLKLKENGWTYFYSTKLKPLDIKEDEHLLSALEEINIKQIYYDSETINVSEIMEEIENEYLFYSDLDEIKPFTQAIFSAIEKSLYSIKHSNINSRFLLDLHHEQFGLYNGEIFCLDPVLYNTDYNL